MARKSNITVKLGVKERSYVESIALYLSMSMNSKVSMSDGLRAILHYTFDGMNSKQYTEFINWCKDNSNLFLKHLRTRDS